MVGKNSMYSEIPKLKKKLQTKSDVLKVINEHLKELGKKPLSKKERKEYLKKK